MVRLKSNFWRPLIVILCEFLAFQSAWGQQGLRIEVVEGAGARNVAQQISAKPITVRVQDASGRPIGGATVIFTSPQTGPSGEFSNDSRTFETLTDSDGLAAAGNYHPNAILGSYQIQARAQVQGQTATALIAQQNVEGSKGHGKMIAVLVIAGAAAGAVVASRRTNKQWNDCRLVDYFRWICRWCTDTMRLLTRALGIACILAAAFAPTTLFAQFHGPILGFVSDGERTAIRPIWGVPGASSLGDSLLLETPVRLVTISPQQEYALVAQGDSQLSLIDLTQDLFTSQPIAALPGGTENLVISPAGSAAAAYAQPGILRVLAGLPRTPRLLRDLDLSGIPGDLFLIGISDDGSLALVKSTKVVSSADDESVRTETGLWIIDSESHPWRVPAERASAAAFLPNRSDIVVADDASGEVFLIRDIGQSYGQIPLTRATSETGSFSTVSTSADGRQVFLGASTTGNVLITDITSGYVALLSCGCSPTGLDPLKGTSVFRLTEASSDPPVFVLDASTATPRIVMVPPKISQ